MCIHARSEYHDEAVSLYLYPLLYFSFFLSKIIKMIKVLKSTQGRILVKMTYIFKRTPRGMEWGGRREEGSGWGTHVYLWKIHFDIWQNQYNIVKFKKKIKKKRLKKINK